MPEATRTLEAAIKYVFMWYCSLYIWFRNSFHFKEIIWIYTGIDCTGSCLLRRSSRHWKCIKSAYCFKHGVFLSKWVMTILLYISDAPNGESIVHQLFFMRCSRPCSCIRTWSTMCATMSRSGFRPWM
jgi:hypothetical protein